MSYLNEFVTRIQKNDYTSFLGLWEEYCNSDELDADELIAILEVVRSSDMAPNLARHLERMIPLWEKLQDKEKSYQILKLIVDLQHVYSDVISGLALKTLEERYGNSTRFQEKLKLAGFRNREKIAGAIRNFELLNHLEKGHFVFHLSGWGVGEVIDVSFLREEFSVEFELVAGKKTLSFATAFKTLAPISHEHLLAQRFSNPDALEALAKKEPVAVIRKLLEDLGPKSAAEIKEELCDLVIPQEDWTKWWQQTRAKLKKDPLIDSPDDLKAPFRIRKEQMTAEERVKKMLAAVTHPVDGFSAVYAFFRDFPETLKNPHAVQLAITYLMGLLQPGELKSAEEITLYLLLEELGHHEKKSALENLIRKESDWVSVIHDIQILSLKKKVMALIKLLRDDWKMLFELFLLHIDYNPLRDYVYGELVDSGASKELHHFVHKVILHPYDAPEAYLWMFQKGEAETEFLTRHQIPQSQLFEGLLILLSRIESSSKHKSMIKKIMNLITEDRYALVRAHMARSTIQEVKEFLLLSTKCVSFSDHELKIFQSLAEVAHPSLMKSVSKTGTQDDPNLIWCTQEGFHKMQKRVHHIATVETVENAREIEVARGHGDLRENAEFKAALERRDRLQSELKLLSDQLNRARVLSKEDIHEDEIGVGCVVDCENNRGQKTQYTILGPWEADTEKNILSYQSKLAQLMRGKVKGDHFKFQDDEFTITAIGSYLD